MTAQGDLWDRLQSFLNTPQPDELRSSTIERTREALDVIARAYTRYGHSRLAISYNGGKDCLVLLVLYVAYLQSIGRSPSGGDRIPTVYVSIKDPFVEVDDFVSRTAVEYGLDVEHIKRPMKEAFELYLSAHTDIEAVLVGTRRDDPHGQHLKHFDPTDQGWPAFMRVHPIIDWSYGQIWDFLRGVEVEYCVLYDRGYTSLGGTSDTLPNPSLAIVNDEQQDDVHNQEEDGHHGVRYRPAWALTDGSEERLGRERARKSEPSKVSRYNSTASEEEAAAASSNGAST